MFRIAIGLLVVALLAAIFGFGGLAGTATDLAKIVFVVALVLAVIGFLMGRGKAALGLVLGLSLPALASAGSGSLSSEHASQQAVRVTPAAVAV
jgi:uncharacterized membrane protein YtjA (UPF0391 family)